MYLVLLMSDSLSFCKVPFSYHLLIEYPMSRNGWYIRGIQRGSTLYPLFITTIPHQYSNSIIYSVYSSRPLLHKTRDFGLLNYLLMGIQPIWPASLFGFLIWSRLFSFSMLDSVWFGALYASYMVNTLFC